MHLLDIRPSTVVHRNRTSPFYKNNHTYDKNIVKPLEEISTSTSKDVNTNSKTRSKSRGGNSRGRLKLIREDLEWFNSNASTEGLSDDSYKHI